VFFAWGAVIYFRQRTPPQDSAEVYTVAKQWMWKFEHMEGQREINELHVPVGRDVKMIMTSQDVIHSFFVPAFRIKQDVLPGRYTVTWFHATKPGTYHLFCAEYCGTSHSGMVGSVVVMEPKDYEAWLTGGGNQPLAVTGERLFSELGCITCHRSDTPGRGPNLVGVFGKPVMLEDGRTLTADENYIRESIVDPSAKIVRGFNAIGFGRLAENAARPDAKTGVPIAGDDKGAIALAEALIREIGFEPVLVGGLAMGKFLVPGTPLAGEHAPDELKQLAATLKS